MSLVALQTADRHDQWPRLRRTRRAHVGKVRAIRDDGKAIPGESQPVGEEFCFKAGHGHQPLRTCQLGPERLPLKSHDQVAKRR